MRQLRYFIEIIEAGSYTQAAERLFIAQSALSRHIKELESAMQVQLLLRDSKPLRMTPSGQAFYDGAKQILAKVNETVMHARRADSGARGVIRILHSSSVPLGSRITEPLRAYLQAHPGVEAGISQASSESQGAEVEAGRADVGLVRLPTHRKFPNLQVRELYTEALVLAVAAGHRLARQPVVEAGALRGEPFVSMPNWAQGGLSYRVAEMCMKNGFVPRAAAATSRKTTLLSLVQAGFGVAVVPESMGAIMPPGIQLVPLAGLECTSTVALIHHHDCSVLAEQFIAALLEHATSPAGQMATGSPASITASLRRNPAPG
jgi:DNA-binding transcriptional LysR family regulator